MFMLASIGRVALITGGAGALGRAIARRLSEDGVSIVLADLDGALCDQVAATIGVGGFGVSMDVTVKGSVTKAIASVVDRHGRIDILVNGAGISVPGDTSAMGEADFMRVLDVNLVGAFRVVQAVVPIMIEQRYGRLVHLGSRNSLAGGMPAYGASKAGLEALSVSWAREYGDYNITSNTVAPGPVRVEQGLGLVKRTEAEQAHLSRHLIARTPIGRLATSADVAAAVAYFASEAAGFVTGETLFVAGGAQLAPLSRYASDPV
jgi:3-oxoacyl-[acyl-carrier protein] reductase